jgi:hypothetical protein
MDDDANKRGRNKPESTYSEFFVEVFGVPDLDF